MNQIAHISIDAWGKHGFVVVGSFNDMEIVSSRIFIEYGDALKEMQRLLLREIFRYENNINNRPVGEFRWDQLPLDPESDR